MLLANAAPINSLKNPRRAQSALVVEKSCLLSDQNSETSGALSHKQILIKRYGAAISMLPARLSSTTYLLSFGILRI